jgi:glycosyltransferase involved in cell wall biosynthesis
MRLLVVAQADPSHASSGAERVLREHVAALRRRGHAVTVLSGAATTRVREDGLTVQPVGWSPLTPWRARRALRTLGAPDAVLLHHPYPGALLVGARALAGVPLALAYLSPWHEEYLVRDPRARGRRRAALAGVRRRIERRVVRRADVVLPMSRFMAGRVRDLHGVPSARVRVVPGGVDRARFTPPADRRALRARLGIDDGARLVVTLRNLEPRMGLSELLRAMPAVRAAHPGVRLVVAGNGPLAATLRAETAALDLAAAVRFAGFVPEAELAAFYGAADLFVIPSRALEGFGLVTLESLACGTPVAGTPVGATPELLAPLDPALVFDGASSGAIAHGLVRALARGDAEALRARCRAYTASFTWDAVAEALEAELTPRSAR